MRAWEREEGDRLDALCVCVCVCDHSANCADGVVVSALSRCLRLSPSLTHITLCEWGTALVEDETATAALCGALAANRHLRCVGVCVCVCVCVMSVG